MPTLSITNFGGINTQVNPLQLQDGNVVQSLNVTSQPFGAVTKRPGYTTFLTTVDGSAVQTLFGWWRQNGTQMNLYRASGNKLYYSLQGTGAWTQTGGDQSGTISPGAHFGHAVLNDVMAGGDGFGSSRYSTDGTSFTSIANAPVSQFWLQYQQRGYALGTGAAFAYSSANDISNWTTGGTSDSATFDVGGEGAVSYLFKNSDRVLFVMSGLQSMLQWDGFNLVDLANDLGPTSPYSFDQSENLGFWLNHSGVYSYSGSAPQIISNPIQRLIYNNAGSGIAGTVFDTAPGGVHRYDYLLAVGATTDDFTGVTVNDAILKYDIRLNQFNTWQFADLPKSFYSYRDVSGIQQLIFGNSTGQVFRLDGTATTDNGTAIESLVQFVCWANTINPKNWFQYRMVFNPGCEIKVEAAVTHNFSSRAKNWFPLNQAVDGVVTGRFPTELSQGEFLFIKVSDNSLTNGFTMYGCEIDFEVVVRR